MTPFQFLWIGPFFLLEMGCSSLKKPCTDAGDLSGLPTLQGNKQCYQKKLPDGTYVNDGKFIQWHPNGQVAIDGGFYQGMKSGKWIFYNEQGRKIDEKDYGR